MPNFFSPDSKLPGPGGVIEAGGKQRRSSMIEMIWEFVVKEKDRGQFELAFGPGGAWSKLFAGSPGFRGTTLLRDINIPNKYLAVDIWDSLDLREKILTAHEAEYARLDAALAAWTKSKAEVGVYRVLAEATVQPRGGRRRRRRGASL